MSRAGFFLRGSLCTELEHLQTTQEQPHQIMEGHAFQLVSREELHSRESVRLKLFISFYASSNMVFKVCLNEFFTPGDWTWMNLETIILSKLTEEQKIKHRMFSLIGHDGEERDAVVTAPYHSLTLLFGPC
ncbi:proline-rich protein, Y-linked [Cebus imitator]|uniref:proline-rich protein, Y-linked n=1 Tax=Cebus imitator TaxID=2715852 RepID=UPI001896DCF5|nr:proline-rich protein, Y-linked [Cebus imitator]